MRGWGCGWGVVDWPGIQCCVSGTIMGGRRWEEEMVVVDDDIAIVDGGCVFVAVSRC